MVINQMVHGRERGKACARTQHIPSTAPGDADHISNNNQKFIYRPVGWQPDCDIFTMEVVAVSPRCVSLTPLTSASLGIW